MQTFVSVTITVVAMYTAYGLRRNNSEVNFKLAFLSVLCAVSTLAWACHNLNSKSFDIDSPWAFAPIVGMGLLVVEALKCRVKKLRELLDSKEQIPNLPRRLVKGTILFTRLLMWLMIGNTALTGGIFIWNIFS